MSLATWKQKYYPIPADSPLLDTDAKAIKHSLRKWCGLRPKNLAAHKVKVASGDVYDVDNVYSASGFRVGAHTCALCVRARALCVRARDAAANLPGGIYPKTYCRLCPLFKYLGRRCDDGVWSRWYAWQNDHNPEPMIEALRGAYRQLKGL